MNFLELARKRCSVRRYIDRPIPDELIYRCLEAARLAPSACNSQPWEFITVTDPEKVGYLARETVEKFSGLNKWTKQAPVITVVIAKKPNLSSSFGALVKNRPFWLMDVGMAAEHFCLQAAEEGLGTCMLGWFNEKQVKKVLSLKGRERVVLLITMGYPAAPDEIKTKVRKSPEETGRIVK